MTGADNSMRRIAVGILLVGFVFVFFRLAVLDIDLLMDPVGFLLLFNGVRALQKIQRATAARPQTETDAARGETPARTFLPGTGPLALVLVVLSGVMIFFPGAPASWSTPLLVCGAVFYLLQALYFIFLGIGFGALLRAQGRRRLSVLAQVALPLAATACLLQIPSLFAYAGDFYAGFVFGFTLGAHLFTLGVFVAVWLAFSTPKQGAPPR